MASYVFCRVCDERHGTYARALDYLAGLVRDERYYTRNETPPKIMSRSGPPSFEPSRSSSLR